MNYKIYGLRLKNTEDIKYVGYTKKLIEERLHEHLTETIKHKYKNGYWVKKYKEEIEILLIEGNIETKKEAGVKEIFYIKFYKELGHDLNNLTKGGDGGGRDFGYEHKEETKLKIGKKLKGRKFSDETINKMSESAKGRIISEETKQKISESEKGKKHSEESKKKMSESAKGKILSEETRKRISESKKGKKRNPMSEETKKKMSESAKKRGPNNIKK